MKVLRVADPGMLTTIQDLGRPGHRAAGIAPGGAFDEFALRAANLLCGNDEGAAALEITLRGPKLEALADTVVAVAGADLSATANGRPLPMWRPVSLRRGTVVAFGKRVAGCRAYLAVGGGIEAPAFLGSRSTDVRCALGPPRLVPGTVVSAGRPRRPRAAEVSARAVAVYANLPELRVVPGPDKEWFPPEAFEKLLVTDWRLRSASDRSGLRLTGGIVPRRPGELPSEPVAFGHVQVPPDGEPIVLGPECQSVGGYPRIGCVITADRPRLSQIAPGDPIRFAVITPDEARWLWAGQHALLDILR